MVSTKEIIKQYAKKSIFINPEDKADYDYFIAQQWVAVEDCVLKEKIQKLINEMEDLQDEWHGNACQDMIHILKELLED